MRRGNPFADGLPHLRSQWIALSLTLRAMTILVVRADKDGDCHGGLHPSRKFDFMF